MTGRGRGVGRGRSVGRGRGRRGAVTRARTATPGWKRINDEPNYVAPHQFSVRNPGPRELPPRNSAPVDYFLLLFSLATIRSMLQNTRLYGERFLDNMTDWIARHPRSRFRRWSMDEINMSSMKKYLGLLINMGLIRKKNVKDYRSLKFPSQSTPFFRSVMSYNKFMLLSRLLHVGALDAPARGQQNFDPWSKVRPVLDAVNASFK